MKFTKGIKVKIIMDVSYHSFPIGSIIEIMEQHPDPRDAMYWRAKDITTGDTAWVTSAECAPLEIQPEPVGNPICCGIPMEPITIAFKGWCHPKFECSVCGDIYLSDGDIMKNKVEEVAPKKTRKAPEAQPGPQWQGAAEINPFNLVGAAAPRR